MGKGLLKSPWMGAAGVVASWFWETFWLIGPPVGINQADRKIYLFWGMVAMMVCAVQAFGSLLRQSMSVSAQLQEINEAKPKINLKLPGAVHCTTVQHTFWEEGTRKVLFSGQVPFLRVAFRNDPPNSFPKIRRERCQSIRRLLSNRA